MRVSREKSSFTAFHLCRRTGRTSVLPVRRHFAASCNVFFKPRAEQNLFGLCRGEEKVRDSELMPFDEKIWQRFLAGFSGKIPFYCRALSLGNGLYVKYSPSPHSVVAWYNTAFDEKLFFSEKAPFSAPRSNPPMGRTSVLPIGGFFACGFISCTFSRRSKANINFALLVRLNEKVV